MKAILPNACQISPGKVKLSTSLAKGTLESELSCSCSVFPVLDLLDQPQEEMPRLSKALLQQMFQ